MRSFRTSLRRLRRRRSSRSLSLAIDISSHPVLQLRKMNPTPARQKAGEARSGFVSALYLLRIFGEEVVRVVEPGRMPRSAVFEPHVTRPFDFPRIFGFVSSFRGVISLLKVALFSHFRITKLGRRGPSQSLRNLSMSRAFTQATCCS